MPLARVFSFLLFLVFTLMACDHDRPQVISTETSSKVDSAEFRTHHHYWRNYNFLATEKIALSPSLPSSFSSIYNADSAALQSGDAIVVVDISSDPSDPQDTLWVMVAHDAQTMGWVRNSELRRKVVPDFAISRFVRTFSSSRVLVLLSVLGVGIVFFLVQNLRHARFQMVHLRDIQSIYPTLLCLVVSTSATLYGALQQFAPEVWTEFYYHPTLNPFVENPFSLRLFLLSLWSMLIVGIAVIDDLRHQPGVVDAVSYLSSLAGVCMVLYLFFTQSVHIYVGYVALPAYWTFALHRHFTYNSARYRCGQCGAAMRRAGTCSNCHAVNV